MDAKAEYLACVAKKNKGKAKKEIDRYALHILNNHRYDNLESFIELATKHGFVGVEWIDMLGLGVMEKEFAIGWAKNIIKEQNLTNVLEPYYNTVTCRLGVVLRREVLRKYDLLEGSKTFMPMPIELRLRTAH